MAIADVLSPDFLLDEAGDVIGMLTRVPRYRFRRMKDGRCIPQSSMVEVKVLGTDEGGTSFAISCPGHSFSLRSVRLLRGSKFDMPCEPVMNAIGDKGVAVVTCSLTSVSYVVLHCIIDSVICDVMFEVEKVEG